MPEPRMIRREFLVQAAGWTALPPGASAQPEQDPPLPVPLLTMNDWHQAIRAARSRIGRLVFVRYTRLGGVETGAVLPLLVRMVAEVRAWIEQPAERIGAHGSAASGQVCLTVQFRDGATALISYGRGAAQGDGLDLLLLGNHGALSYDGGTGLPWDAPLPAAALGPAERKLQTVITRALKSGQLEKVTQD